jgi:hypothetical protein
MMIDPNSETLLSLAQAAKHLPRRRGGRPVHVSCIYRWTTSGCKGVILESIQIGGTRCTSRQALSRFFRRLTDGTTTASPTIRTPARRARDLDRAMSELDKAGV